MAKGLGLIGNFRGKFGNAVGYNLKDSNNKQTQGIRIYQPIVKNPKTYAQAEQRARMAVINATYRILKSVIDRGQETATYGNKSRLRWLSDAMKTFKGGWIVKGASIPGPAQVFLTRGSLATVPGIEMEEDQFSLSFRDALQAAPTTVGEVSTALVKDYDVLKNGDQITFIYTLLANGALESNVVSLVIDTQSTTPLSETPFRATTKAVFIVISGSVNAWAVVHSREGDGGEHLRSTSVLTPFGEYKRAYFSEEAKDTAIRSYMATGTSTDWPQEPIKD